MQIKSKASSALKKSGHNIQRLGLTLVTLSVLSGLATTYAMANSPQLELFPVSVQESFKQAETQTLQMQNELNRIVHEMNTQERLYNESRCDQLSDDEGCSQLKSQMQEKFMALNSMLQQSLPEVKKAVEHAHKTMGGSLSRMAQKYTPSQLIKLNHDAMQSDSVTQPTVSARTPLGRIAAIFSKINKSIGSRQTNMYVLASQTYADLSEIKKELALLEQNTRNNAVIDIMNFTPADMSDESIETIGHFRAMIMGDEDGYNIPSYPEQNSTVTYEERLSQFY